MKPSARNVLKGSVVEVISAPIAGSPIAIWSVGERGLKGDQQAHANIKASDATVGRL